MTTRAIRVRDGFLLIGAKRWITNGTLADVAVIWAKLDGQVHGFLVEKGTPGFQTSEMEGKFSFRASVTSELTFDDCLIPEANLLAEAEGLKAPLMCLNQARYGIVDEYPVMRHLLNLETVKTYEGTHDIHTLILGRDITGISAIE
jgi:glutaryl-CoA dehydrogenase